ncbi:MAG: SDR family NAD(P)-dependent oxidoreductase [Chloroflexota bacterium]
MPNQPVQDRLLSALQKSAVVIQKQEQGLAAYHEPIAIVGMGCRYPGDSGDIDSPEQFWDCLMDGFDAIIELPDERAQDLFGYTLSTLSSNDVGHPLSNGSSTNGAGTNGAGTNGAEANGSSFNTSGLDEMFVSSHSLHGGFLRRVDQFDPAFFGLSPREVLVMDPAHRLLLETTWQALEAANIVPIQLFNSEMGVFIGSNSSGYTEFCASQENNLYTATGNTASTSAGRLSYVLGITGPCVSVDTACSSSLAAIHLACQSLRNGECSAALAGGVNVILNAGSTNMFASGNMLSDDAHCKTFDAAANGYVRGEGCGIIVLKRLSDAQSAQDSIMAVIRGTAINQDGPSGGLTVPNGPSQERVIRRALDDAGLSPHQIQYIEAHGTGTPLGDPIEIGALSSVFGQRTDPLYVGSVKTNIGHLELAAGVAGLMKLVLSLQKGKIPPHLHLNTPNPHIDWDASPVQVPTEATDWLRSDETHERIGGVSSFGFSGTNAHVIISEAPSTEALASVSVEPGDAVTERPAHILTLSAKSSESLHAYVQRYHDFLAADLETNLDIEPETYSKLDIGDLCYTTHVSRSHFAHRLSVTATSTADLQQQLDNFLNTGQSAHLSQNSLTTTQAKPRIAFLFTGQGAQYGDMGRELYETNPTFRATLDKCDELLREHLGESLLAILYSGIANQEIGIGQEDSDSDGTPPAPSPHPLSHTQYTQPALFALEVALAGLWQSWGIQPDILMGHSVGEIAAACVAQVFSLEDGLRLIAARGRLMGALPQDGEMISLMTDEARAREAIATYYENSEPSQVSIAAINGPESVVISGKRDAVLAIAEQLAAEGIKTRQLAVSHAFHSPLMEPMLDEFRQVAESITYHQPAQPLISNVTGKLADEEITTPAYWVRHVREAVRFADGVATLHEAGNNIFLEIGPKPTLVGMAQEVLEKEAGRADDKMSPTPLTLPSLRENQHDWQQMITSLGALYTHGVQVDWEGFDKHYQRRKVGLPTYPFQKQRYWPEQNQQINGSEAENGFSKWLTHNLSAGRIEALTDLIARRSEFVEDEREAVAKVLTALDAESRSQQMTAQVKSMLYEVAWERQNKPVGITSPIVPGHWLILADAGGIGEIIEAQLMELGETVEIVTEQSMSRYDFAGRGEHLARLLAKEEEGLPPLRGVIHLWALNESLANGPSGSENADDSGTALMQRQEQALGTVLHLVQIMADAQGVTKGTGQNRGQITESAETPRLWVVTQGAQQLTAADQVAVAQAPLWGMGRVATLEHGDLWGGLIDLESVRETDKAPDNDVDNDDDGADEERELNGLTQVVQTLLAELLSPEADEEQIAYRQGQRYVARLVSAHLPDNSSTSEAKKALDPNGTYLVTGGLGSLGLQNARWLVEQGARQIVLTGRRGVQSEHQQAFLDELAAEGIEVNVAQVDVADSAAMTSLLEEIAQTEHPLKGVIHAAGIAGYKAIRSLDWDEFASVLRPKVMGGWLLHQLTEELNLDLFICYASGAGIWGGKQQAHYGAANHFLDGLMAYRRSQGLPGLSIAWGPWAGDAGSSGGLSGMATPEGQAMLQAMGVRSFAPALGLAIQTYLVQSGAVQITAADIDWSRLKTLYEMTKPRPFLANVAAEDEAAKEATKEPREADGVVIQTIRNLPVADRLDGLRDHVQQTVSHVLGMSEPAGDLLETMSGFADLGMDSLMALELRRQLEEVFQCTLPSTVAFEYPTVEALSAYLLDEVLALAETPLADTHLAKGEGAHPAHSQGAEAGVQSNARTNEGIAVISMACRFPGADTPETFWELLKNGVDMVQEMPSLRWNVDDFYDPQRPSPGKMYTREAALLDDVEHFDPLFFGIAPREAEGMDPHHRLLLEISWEALERAGIAPSTLVDSQTGVFVGIGESDYSAGAPGENTYFVTSSGHSAAAGRIAYTLGLQGPTMAVDTACSSSLVSLHLACQSLRAGECRLALAGGINLTLSPFGYIALSQMQTLSPDGRCKTFDATADGYGRGEGSSMVLLKRLRDAEADGDTILAIIKGSAVNHDGPSSGLTVPNKIAQEKVIRQALATAQVQADDVTYIEAHGTGTSLGDPIEMRALDAVFGSERSNPLLVGSVKTNLGHLEAASGIVGFVKIVLSLQNGQIPPHLHFNTPSPFIEWDRYAIGVPTKLQPWPSLNGVSSTEDGQRIAGISSFGISGTNAHIVVASGPKRESIKAPLANSRALPDSTFPEKTLSEDSIFDCETEAVERPQHLLLLSAKNPEALPDLAGRYIEHFRTYPDLYLGDLCYTAAVGRNHFTHRVGIVAANHLDMQANLAILQRGKEADGILQGLAQFSSPRIAFLFTGQGSQYLGMGRDLYETEPVFRDVIDRCDTVAQIVLGRSLIDLLYPVDDPDHNDIMDSHPCGQAVNFAVECALVELWRSWGIQPHWVLGHSLGDFAAAYTAGVLSLEDGLRLVSERGRLMERAIGSMVSVIGAEEDVSPFVDPYDDVVIGVINGPRSVVISGGDEHVVAVTAALKEAGFKTRKVAVPMAAHSPLLDPVLDEFERLIRDQIELSPPQGPVVSSMTGTVVSSVVSSDDSSWQLTDPTYWRHHLRNPVRFADGVQTLAAEGCNIFIEIGPKPTLLGMVGQIIDDDEEPVLLSSLHHERGGWQQMLTSLGELYVQGIKFDWESLDKAHRRHKIQLPTYPFQRERYWVAPPKVAQYATLRPLIHQMSKLPLRNEIIFEAEFSVETVPFLADQRISGAVVASGSSLLAMVLSAGELTFGQGDSLTVQDVVWSQVLVVPDPGASIVQTILTSDRAGQNGAKGNGPRRNGGSRKQRPASYKFQLFSYPYLEQDAQGEMVDAALHATGMVTTQKPGLRTQTDLTTLRQQCNQALDTALIYESVAMAQIQIGPRFRWLSELWSGQDNAQDGAADNEPSQAKVERLAKLVLPDAAATVSDYLLHPGLLDACFQIATLATKPNDDGQVMMPFTVDALHLFQSAHDGNQTTWWCHACKMNEHSWDISLFNEQGTLIATIDGYEMRAVPLDSIRRDDAWEEWLYEVDWQPHPYFGLQPDYLPTPEALVSSFGEPQSADEAVQKWAASLEPLAVDYVLKALATAGFTFKSGDRWRTEQIIQQVSVVPSSQKLLERLLEIMAEAGLLQKENDFWIVVEEPALADPVPAMAALQTQISSRPDPILPEVSLLARCGEKVSEVLRGLQDPVDVLFPGGDTALVTDLYTKSPRYQVFNEWLQQITAQVVETLPATQGLRIMEISGGASGLTGGIARTILPLLPAGQTDYLLTGTDSEWLNSLQDEFGDYPFVRYGLLDSEQPVNGLSSSLFEAELTTEAQGLGRYQTDLLVANGLLSMANDVTETLTNIRQLLHSSGHFIFLEDIQRNPVVDLTVGLLAPQADPLLTVNQWETLLLEHGFQSVQAIEHLGRAMIVGQADDTVTAGTDAGETWLIFADTQGVGDGFANQLRKEGDRAVLLYVHEHYEQIDEETFRIQPNQAEEYQRFLTQFTKIDGLVYLWSLDTDSVPYSLNSSSNVADAAKLGYDALWQLVQGLEQSGSAHSDTTQPEPEPLSLWLVTQDALAVTKMDSVQGVAQAGVWGLGKVIAREHPHLHCVSIDLSAYNNPDSPDRLASQLLAEIRSADLNKPLEMQIAHRPEARYLPRLKRHQVGREILSSSTRLENDPSISDSTDNIQASQIHADATYLLTSSPNGIGLMIAQWLVEEGARHLLLVERWHPGAKREPLLDSLQDELQEILTSVGGDLTIVHSDFLTDASVSNSTTSTSAEESKLVMQKALAGINAAYPLRGLILAAGLLDEKANLEPTLLEPDEKRFVGGVDSGIQDAWHLHEMTLEMSLDFFVVFTSTALLLAQEAQAMHGATSAFLDAFVQYRRRQGLPVLGINWSQWANLITDAQYSTDAQPDTDSEPVGEQQLSAELGLGAVTPVHGIRAFAYLLRQNNQSQNNQSQSMCQMGVSPIDWPTFLESLAKPNPFYAEFVQPLEDVAIESSKPFNLRQQLDEADQAERGQLLLNYLRMAVGEVLGLRNPEQIDPRQGLLEMGLDSLMAVELRNRMGRALEHRLPSTLVFDYPTIDALQTFLADEFFDPEVAGVWQKQHSDIKQAMASLPDEMDTVEALAAAIEAESEDDADGVDDTNVELKDADSEDDIAEMLAQLVYSDN